MIEKNFLEDFARETYSSSLDDFGIIARGLLQHHPAVTRIPRKTSDEPIQLTAGLKTVQASQAAELLLVDLGTPAERAGESYINVDSPVCLATTMFPGVHDI